ELASLWLPERISSSGLVRRVIQGNSFPSKAVALKGIESSSVFIPNFSTSLLSMRSRSQPESMRAVSSCDAFCSKSLAGRGNTNEAIVHMKVAFNELNCVCSMFECSFLNGSPKFIDGNRRGQAVPKHVYLHSSQ
ncbi:hypothetical protein XENOCAPTIV_024231, partial [Xenoophorus captivus]